MSRVFLILLLLFSFASGSVQASTLEYSIEGVRGDLRRNIKAWLGREPDTAQERANFIATAQQRIALSLQALGHYSPDIQILLDKSAPQWRMQIEVDAGEAVRIADIDIRIVGDAAEDEAFARFVADFPLNTGDVLNHGEYDRFRRQITALAQQRGYFDGVVLDRRVEVNAGARTANITLHFSSGQRYRFGEIRLDKSIVDMRWVNYVVNFETGDLFDLALLQQLRGELQRTRYFSSVIVRPQLDELSQGQVPVSVQVSPANRHNLEFGIGFSTDTEERVSATWRTPAINRYGHSQETRLEYSPVSPSGRFIYNIPLSHPLNDVLHLSAYQEDREYGDLDSHQKGLRVRRELRQDNWIHSYSLRTLDEAWDVESVRRDNYYLLPGASLSHKSRRGSLVDPDAGFHQAYFVEGGHQDMGSDINLFRISGNFRFVTTLAPRHRLVARSELGAVFIDDSDRKDLAPSLSFFTGGSQSIRGFSYQSIGNESTVIAPDGSEKKFVVGGDRLFVTSVEYQYYFSKNLRGAVFTDAGDAFDDGEFDLHYGSGFGVHYISPVGAIRLELANDLSEDDNSWRLHLNIGAEF
jgi:translocation and assembly module TamA